LVAIERASFRQSEPLVEWLLPLKHDHRKDVEEQHGEHRHEDSGCHCPIIWRGF
jgi:hypothetical protein